MKRERKKVLVIATGGTIASKKTKDGLSPQIKPEIILNYVPDIKEICNVDIIQLFNIDSTNMTPKHWLKVAQTIEKNYEKYDGYIGQYPACFCRRDKW